MFILGIETSCDETGIAFFNYKKKILYEYTYSQIIHNLYGGTIPELSSKDHLKKIFKLIFFIIKNNNISITHIKMICYTKGPGLKASLLIGSVVGKSLGYILNIPSLGINHLEAHILISYAFNKKINFPALSILMSGGHTLLIKMNNYNNFIILGSTLDDSIGETFDKVARHLKLNPANGLSIYNSAKKNVNFKNLNYPKSLYRTNCLNFSLSGIKSSVISKDFFDNVNNISYNFQNTIINIIKNKCVYFFKNNIIRTLIISGGVSSNIELRLILKNLMDSYHGFILFSPIKYSTDNGAMIAFSGYIKFLNNEFDRNLIINVHSDFIFNN
jgi:N6-L-threonylcarbamoyladenine synthase